MLSFRLLLGILHGHSQDHANSAGTTETYFEVFEPTDRDSTLSPLRTGFIWEVKIPLDTFFILEEYSVGPNPIYSYIDNDTVDNVSLLQVITCLC